MSASIVPVALTQNQAPSLVSSQRLLVQTPVPVQQSQVVNTPVPNRLPTQSVLAQTPIPVLSQRTPTLASQPVPTLPRQSQQPAPSQTQTVQNGPTLSKQASNLKESTEAARSAHFTLGPNETLEIRVSSSVARLPCCVPCRPPVRLARPRVCCPPTRSFFAVLLD
ncbi:unnamed protein product [Brachionus calyciflorus]|uniref:Uncharacterized protein n=1 Tax=Brachionus calyciflorus TaxID=104777 RepID=A0A814A8B8_9BILA|nr:unnamed protein product [Brachionus calyciflorus]